MATNKALGKVGGIMPGHEPILMTGRTTNMETVHLTSEGEDFVKQYKFFTKLSMVTIAGKPNTDK